MVNDLKMNLTSYSAALRGSICFRSAPDGLQPTIIEH